MRKVCVLIALTATASAAIADPSAAVLWGPKYAFVLEWPTHRWGLRMGAEPVLPPLLAQARICFERPAAEQLIHSIEQLSTDALSSLHPSPERYELLDGWLRSTCPLAVDSI
jgi:hypothetical protein